MSTLERLERANPVADADRLLFAPGAMDDFVLAVKERSGIVQTAEDRAPIEVPTETKTEPPRKDWRRRLVPVLVAAAAVIAAIVVAAIWTSAQNDEPDVANQPTEQTTPPVEEGPPVMTVAEGEAVVGSFVNALQAGDAGAARALIITDGGVGPDYVGWLIPLDTTGVEFFDCKYEPGSVTCQTTMGPGHFFERIHGQNVENTFSATLENGLIVNPTWPAQPTDTAAERAFRTWAQETHPELDEVMFDTSFLGVIFTEESGQARTQLIDEYLASL